MCERKIEVVLSSKRIPCGKNGFMIYFVLIDEMQNLPKV